MKNSIEKFLEFDGKTISFLSVDGEWWVAMKPICDVLNIDYEAQRKSVKDDEILSQLPSEQTVVAADGKLRKMICLPEKYIYGWLFSIQSNSEQLLNYKRTCYDILFDHFHGGIRGKKVMEKMENTAQIESLNKTLDIKLKTDPDYIKVKELESANVRIGKEISQLAREEITSQLNMFRERYKN